MTSSLQHADVVQWLRENEWFVQNGYMPKYHAVLADPPYAIDFMSKSWDSHATPQAFQAWVTEWARLLLSFVHPGAVLLMAGGTRTYHRLAAGLEDAGWEVDDSLAVLYAYGSGFPKSLDISKAIDRQMGVEREIVGSVRADFGKRNGVKDSDGGIFLNSLPEELKRVPITAPASAQSALWEGFGTALKPAYEPFVLARAPRGKHTYADLTLTFGSGAINVDGGRIPSNGDVMRRANNITIGGNGIYQGGKAYETGSLDGRRFPANLILTCACDGSEHDADCPVRVMDEQSGEIPSSFRANRDQHKTVKSGMFSGSNGATPYDDSGGSSRFFYTAKASSWEREAGLSDFTPQTVNDGRNTPIDNAFQRGETQRRNTHPTVKPIALCEYLAKLLLPPPLDTPRRILVPFAGSGSEMIGAHLAGWDVIDGIELSAEYVPINAARRKWWEQFTSYEQARRAAGYDPQEQIQAGQLDMFAYLDSTGASAPMSEE